MYTNQTPDHCACGDVTGIGRGECSGRTLCDCSEESLGLRDYPLAMVYSPCQKFRELYDINEALNHGTLFKELYLPFEAGRRGNCV
ncbi:MAG: spore coat associated protein CotJA [Clostridia bacterium]|nr:spore coat associated protein CotJA [Clostridia bacterium]